MNFPDLICLLQTGSPRTFTRHTSRRKKKKQKVVVVNTDKKCIRIQSQQEKKNRR